jgi:hypothetical protein
VRRKTRLAGKGGCVQHTELGGGDQGIRSKKASGAVTVSNATIIERMQKTCDQWTAGTIDCLVLGAQLVALAEALENVPRRLVEEAREWQVRLEIASDPASFGERELAITQLNQVVAAIRQWIQGLNLDS